MRPRIVPKSVGIRVLTGKLAGAIVCKKLDINVNVGGMQSNAPAAVMIAPNDAKILSARPCRRVSLRKNNTSKPERRSTRAPPRLQPCQPGSIAICVLNLLLMNWTTPQISVMTTKPNRARLSDLSILVPLLAV